jgi:hypothetical protein
LDDVGTAGDGYWAGCRFGNLAERASTVGVGARYRVVCLPLSWTSRAVGRGDLTAYRELEGCPGLDLNLGAEIAVR